MNAPLPHSASPLLASKTPLWRSRFIVAAMAIAFVGMGARAAYVQVVNNDFFRKQGEVRFLRTQELSATRGRILDRNGHVLASSIPVPSIWAIPEDVDDDPQTRIQLARLLGLSPADLEKKLADEEKGFVWLKRHVSEEIARDIRALKLKGIYERTEYRRHYPEGEAAAHVLGMTDLEGHGVDGAELAFDAQLRGKPGSRKVIKDRLGKVVEHAGETLAPENGQDIQLSIDNKVQFFAYQKLRDAVQQHKAAAGSVVVLDSATGELLAMANYPSYNPNQRQGINKDHARNRVLADIFEPGSTMKPFIAALSLERGLVRPDTVIQTAPGRLTLAGSTITDAHPHGALTVSEVIQKSSNVGTVKLAMQFQPRDMWELYSSVGFGQKPNLPFAARRSGTLRAYKTWKPIEQATMSYGYGLSASLFQLARAYTVFARDGELIPVSVLKTTQPSSGVSIISAKNAAAVRQMLHMATQPGGTAPKAQTMGYSVGGKTGTAHKQEGRGYADKKYRGFFVGLAPIEKPRIVVAVMIDEPSNGAYFGGEVAAPVFSETVAHSLRMLGVQPDMNVKPHLVAKAEEESF